MSQSLHARIKKSTIWVVGGHLLAQLIRLASNLIMTRLLAPDMFGVMALVWVFLIGFGMFSDMGLQQGVIQSKRGEDRKYLNTAWAVQIVRGFLIFFVSILFSIFLYFEQGYVFDPGSVYSDERVPFLLALVSLTVVISGFNSVNMMVMNRNLLVHRVISIELISQLIGLLSMIAIAVYYRDVWVLAISAIIAALVKLYLSHDYRFGEKVKFEFNKECFKEMYKFGRWIFLGSILGFFLSQGDRLILGAYLTPELLGIYSIAYFLSNAVKMIVNKLVNMVFYPALSEYFRESPKMLSDMYYKIRFRIDFVTMAIAGILCSLGEFIVYLLYDDRYYEAGWMFQILSLSILFVGYSLAGACLMARGDSRSHATLVSIRTVVLYIGLPVILHLFGMKFAILFLALNYAVDIPATFYMMNRAGLLNIKKEFIVFPVFVVSYLIGRLVEKFMMEGFYVQ